MVVWLPRSRTDWTYSALCRWGRVGPTCPTEGQQLRRVLSLSLKTHIISTIFIISIGSTTLAYRHKQIDNNGHDYDVSVGLAV